MVSIPGEGYKSLPLYNTGRKVKNMFPLVRDNFFILARAANNIHDYKSLSNLLAEHKYQGKRSSLAHKLQLLFEGKLTYAFKDDGAKRDYEHALELFEDALAVENDSIVERFLLDAYIYVSQADCYALLKDFKKSKRLCTTAEKSYAKGVDAYEKIGIKDVLMEQYIKELRMIMDFILAGIHLDKGESQHAQTYAGASIELAMELDNPKALARGLIIKTFAHISARGFDRAEESINEADALMKAFKNDFLDNVIKFARMLIELRRSGTGMYYKGKSLLDLSPSKVEKVLRNVKLHSVDGIIDPIYKEKIFWKEDPKSKEK